MADLVVIKDWRSCKNKNKPLFRITLSLLIDNDMSKTLWIQTQGIGK